MTQTSAPRILLAEDEEAMRSYLARALTNAGYRVETVDRGTAAIPLLQEQSFDLLLSDIVMPEMDGPELARRVRERDPEMKIVFISGYAEEAFRERLGEDESIHFLPKPFSLKQLAGKVKEAMGGR